MGEENKNEARENKKQEEKNEKEVTNKDSYEKEKNENIKLQDTIILQKQKLDEQEDRLKRLMAEFDNFKKKKFKRKRWTI